MCVPEHGTCNVFGTTSEKALLRLRPDIVNDEYSFSEKWLATLCSH